MSRGSGLGEGLLTERSADWLLTRTVSHFSHSNGKKKEEGRLCADDHDKHLVKYRLVLVAGVHLLTGSELKILTVSDGTTTGGGDSHGHRTHHPAL